MSTPIEWNQIERRLNTCEQIVTGLFSLGFVTIELKEKLCQIEEWMVHIPDSRLDLIEQWNRKLVNWWKAYVTAISLQQGQQQPKQCDSILSDQLSSSNTSLDNKPTNGSIHDLPSKSSQSDSSVNSQVDVQVSKQSTVLSQMEHAFAQLSPVPESANAPEYLDRLTQLATLVTKAHQRSLALGAPSGVRTLKDNIFAYAFAKLSSKLQDSYKQKYSMHDLHSKSLLVLIEFLTKQISDRIQQDDQNRILINIDDIFCKYCKMSGHLKDNCTKKRAMVCFKCFKMGHMQKDCTD